MGTISSLMERLSRKSNCERPAIVVTAFGFTVGPAFVAWQAVSEIQGYLSELPATGEAILQFTCNGHDVHVSAEQPGFEQVEQAMIAVFPSTRDWRANVMQPVFAQCRTLLFRRT
ncbi:hypothetical protein [Lysobacter sp. GCM10012299]|uniref:hypothetical protein n=1 Tax=Lysobacter sp. GCM10012299 TaxID=3317333 RepID=UPI0036225CE5